MNQYILKTIDPFFMHHLVYSLQQPYAVHIIISMLQIKKQ